MSKTVLAKRGEIPVFCLIAPGFPKNTDKTLYSERTTPNKNTRLEWEVFAGESASGDPVIAYSAWSPKLDFSELGEGEYTVRLTAMGPAGEQSIEKTTTIEEKRGDGFGCSSVGSGTGGAGFAFAGLALAFVLGRRRRS